MILKDNERFEFNDTHKKQVHDFIGGKTKFPIMLRYPQALYTPKPNIDDLKRVDRPNKCLIPLRETNLENGVNVEWAYTKMAPSRDKNGDYKIHEGTEGYLEFKGSLPLSKDDYELAWFLLFKSKSSTHHKEANRPIFEVVNNAKAADKAMDKESMEANVRAALFGSGKIPYSDIVRLSKAFGLTLAIDTSESEARLALKDGVFAREKATKDGFAVFLDMIDNEKRAIVLAAITKAKELKLLVFTDGSKKWMLVGPDGKKVKDLCKQFSNKTPEESLLFVVQDEEDVAEAIVKAVTEYEAVANAQTA